MKADKKLSKFSAMYGSGHLYSGQICKPKTALWHYEPQVGIIEMIHPNLNINLAGSTLYNPIIFSQPRITVLITFFRDDRTRSCISQSFLDDLDFELEATL